MAGCGLTLRPTQWLLRVDPVAAVQTHPRLKLWNVGQSVLDSHRAFDTTNHAGKRNQPAVPYASNLPTAVRTNCWGKKVASKTTQRGQCGGFILPHEIGIVATSAAVIAASLRSERLVMDEA